MSKFGLLVYNGTDNLGDEIQSLAAKRFLPQVDYLVDRDALHGTPAKQPNEIFKIIMNGWFFKEHGTWPPPPHIKPIIASFHLTPGAKATILSADGLKYLKQFPEIGARDLFTLKILRSTGLPSFFSGCMTLTLPRPNVRRDDNLLVLNDLREEAIGFIRQRTKKRIMLTWHSGYPETDQAARSAHAQELLEIYASASCVVTSRLHCALPCIAMQTPVLLLDVAPDQERFAGLNDFVRHAPEAKLLRGETVYDWENPPPNPRVHLPYRESLIESIERFVKG